MTLERCYVLAVLHRKDQCPKTIVVGQNDQFSVRAYMGMASNIKPSHFYFPCAASDIRTCMITFEKLIW